MTPRFWLALALIGGALVLSRRSRAALPIPSLPGSSTFIEEGIASFYGPGFNGRQTANQEIFDQNARTAAHRTLPFNTRVRVTDLDTGASVDVRINDRGPFVKNSSGQFTRCIDLSVGSAAAIGLDIQRGLARVRLERLS